MGQAASGEDEAPAVLVSFVGVPEAEATGDARPPSYKHRVYLGQRAVDDSIHLRPPPGVEVARVLACCGWVPGRTPPGGELDAAAAPPYEVTVLSDARPRLSLVCLRDPERWYTVEDHCGNAWFGDQGYDVGTVYSLMCIRAAPARAAAFARYVSEQGLQHQERQRYRGADAAAAAPPPPGCGRKRRASAADGGVGAPFTAD